MMDKETYVKYYNKYIDWCNREDAISEASNDCISFWNIEELSDFKEAYIELMEFATNDIGDYPVLEYFLYELDKGNDYEPGCFEDSHGDNVKLETIEDVWDYLNRCYLEVTACGESENLEVK